MRQNTKIEKTSSVEICSTDFPLKSNVETNSGLTQTPIGTLGTYFGSDGAFERAHLKRRKKLVEELLKKHDAAMRSRIVDECRIDLEDVGMGDIVVKHFIVPRQEEQYAQGVNLAQGEMAVLGGGDAADEMLALRMQMELRVPLLKHHQA